LSAKPTSPAHRQCCDQEQQSDPVVSSHMLDPF
jgi:hypothetical protein